MKRNLQRFAAVGSLFFAMFAAEAVFAQKPGGVLKIYHRDSPAARRSERSRHPSLVAPATDRGRITRCIRPISSRRAQTQDRQFRTEDHGKQFN
jgi:hypothetical protein